METEIRFEELDLLVGEVLPERTVMGSIVVPLGFAGGHGHEAQAADADGGSSSSSASAAGGGGGAGGFGGMLGGLFGGSQHSDTVQSTCQSIGQGQSSVPSLTCMPATIRSY